MKPFYCRCGQAVYFDSSRCIRCGATLGFDVDSLDLVSLVSGDGSRPVDISGRRYLACANGRQFDVCNWLVPESSENELCWGCRFNRTIPDMSRPQNVGRFRRFEIAKKRLLFTVRRLELPLRNGFADPRDGLLFDFIEDQRSSPERYPESYAPTGFRGGIITINALEADDAAREAVRLEMNESYRTLLGHLRHESGHYFWAALDAESTIRADFERLFGDPTADYEQALARYYDNGPVAGWPERFISAYASAHAAEDWAETWAHYLYIFDALETAATHGFIDNQADEVSIDRMISAWRAFSVAFNELNRSSGLADPYPFVITDVVADKLRFVDEVVAVLRARNRAPAGC